MAARFHHRIHLRYNPLPVTGFVVIFSIIGGLLLLFMLTIFIASLLETQHVRELVAMTAENEIAATPYLTAMAAGAAALGYAPGGELRHVKYALRCSTWMAPDRQTIAAIAGGHVVRMATKKTRLISRLGNGAVLVTTDEVGLPDHTGLQTRQLVMNGGFNDLHVAHANWLAAAEAEQAGVRTFEGDAPQELEALDAEMAERMEAFGLIHFTDRAAGTFRHTIKGAIANTFSGLFKGMAEGSRQSHRSQRPRPA